MTAPTDPAILSALLCRHRRGVTLARALDDLALDAPPDPAELAAARDALKERGLEAVAWPDPTIPLALVEGDPTIPALTGAIPRRALGIVGARGADAYGLTITRSLARIAVDLGFTVISGGAEGCDDAAHEAALDAARRHAHPPAPTVAVLPAGHDHPYPLMHAPLFDRIVAEGGALLSASWPTVRPSRAAFIDRNRVIAALCDAVIVVRAAPRSGSLSTAAAARRLGRPVGAVPGQIGASLSEGCHLLLEGGATPITSPAALARFLRTLDPAIKRPGAAGRWPHRGIGQPALWVEDPDSLSPLAGVQRPPPECPEARRVLEAIEAEPGVDLDSLVARTNVAASSLPGLLVELELDGRVARAAGGRYMPSH